MANLSDLVGFVLTVTIQHGVSFFDGFYCVVVRVKICIFQIDTLNRHGINERFSFN